MSRSVRILLVGGAMFLLSGAFHVIVWLAAGTPSLDGPVSWRKPITFGVSTGVLFVSLAWVLSLLPQTRKLERQVAAFTALLVAEVGLIVMQQWRGVPSHFNTTTPFDAAVFTTMGVLILAAGVLIAIWTVALFRQPLPTTPGYRFAARAGMVLLNVGNLIGLVMAATQATALKPLHGVAIHGLQVLPLAVWAAAILRRARAWRGDVPSWQSPSSSR